MTKQTILLNIISLETPVFMLSLLRFFEIRIVLVEILCFWVTLTLPLSSVSMIILHSDTWCIQRSISMVGWYISAPLSVCLFGCTPVMINYQQGGNPKEILINVFVTCAEVCKTIVHYIVHAENRIFESQWSPS